MQSCPQFETWGVPYVYDDLSALEKKTYADHLQSCELCTEEIVAVEATLRLMDRRETVDRDENFWQSFDQKLQEQIVFETSAGPIRPRFGWATQAFAAAAMLVLGIFLGKFWLSPAPPLVNPVTTFEVSLDTAFIREANAYVDQSKTLLIGLTNIDLGTEIEGSLDLALHRQASRSLISQTAHLRDIYPQQAKSRLRDLMDELEMIFLQIAHLEADGSLEGLEVIQEGVSKGDLLLKINLEQLVPSYENTRAKQDPAL